MQNYWKYLALLYNILMNILLCMKKLSNIFFVVKKKTIIYLLLFVIVISSFVFLPSIFATSPSGLMTIVVDAGHGGIDGGSVGYSGTTERVINLDYAKTLKKYLESYGFNVVMTRENLDGLYSAYSTNKKKDDMMERKKIIEDANADLVISIHMNSFPLQSCRGAQVFYNPESEISKSLAESIQSTFVTNLPNARKNIDVGDYYMLNCTNVPSVIVECGFISNAEEEKLLLNEEYREKLCYSILCGVVKYFAESGEIKIND